MISIINTYLQILLHPISTHLEESEQRSRLQTMKKNRLFEVVRESTDENHGLDYVSIILVSWLFFMIYSLYSLAFANLGEILFTDEQTTGFLSSLVSSNNFRRNYFLISLLSGVVFFPFYAWIYVKFWRTIIKFFASIYDKEVEEESIDQVTNYSLVSNFFLIIPVIGTLLKTLCSIYYVFIGLRYNLKFNSIQSATVVFSPLILLGLLFLMIFVYILVIVNLLEFPPGLADF